MTLISKLILQAENPAFASYVVCGSVLVLKQMFMVVLIDTQRIKHSVAISPEDEKIFLKGKTIEKSHEDVERIRRAHLNELQNIQIFFFAGFAYLLTDANPSTATYLFRIYTVARCIHTFVYAVCVVPQPAKVVSFFTGYVISGYMAVKAVLYFHSWPSCSRSIGGFNF